MVLTLKPRLYRCLNCGHEQKITTNHKEPCIDYCQECSWKPSFGKFAIPFMGRTFRPFECIEKGE